MPIPSEKLINTITAVEKKAVNCEIFAETNIKKAQEILLDGLGFDLKSVTGEFSFEINSSELKNSKIWTASYYDKQYIEISNLLKEKTTVKPLSAIVTFGHGDEVGSDNYKNFIDRAVDDLPFIRTSDIVNNEIDLYPDFYVSKNCLSMVKQHVKKGDVIFTKDGKIGCVGMITSEDNAILSSGIEYLRVNDKARTEGVTQEYLFTVLSIPEIGRYAAMRRTVVASTIPHLRVERMKDIEIPIIDSERILKITELVKEAFILKGERKRILKESDNAINQFFDV